MKRLLASLALVAVFALALVGCGSSAYSDGYEDGYDSCVEYLDYYGPWNAYYYNPYGGNAFWEYEDGFDDGLWRAGC